MTPPPPQPSNPEPAIAPLAPQSGGVEPDGPEAPLARAHGRYLSRLLDQTTQPFCVADFDGHLIYVNGAFEKLVGFSAEELRVTTFLELTPEAWRHVSRDAIARLHETGQAQSYEKVYRHKDGHDVQVAILTDFYRDENDVACGYHAFVTDIGERKRTEEALRESEERFRHLYHEAPFGYHEIDRDGTIVSVNRTEWEMLGYTREEMLGRPVFDFIAEEQREEARIAVRERMRGDRPVQSVERTYVTRDGRRLILLIENRLIRDEKGEVTGIRSTMQDISARKQTETALVASERRARALFEGIEDAVFVHDLQGKILDANPAACRQLGYTREELRHLTTADIDDPEFASGYEDRLSAQLREGHLRVEGRHRTKSGTLIPVDINTSLIHLENQTVVLAVIRDITERKALEETRRQFAEAQLKNAWEIESKNRALSLSEARYRQLTEGCLDAIVVADQRGQIALFNPAAERAFGYLAPEVIGRPMVDLMPEDLRGDLIVGLQDYLQSRGDRIVGRTIELRGRRKSGEVFPVEISLSAIEVAGELQFMAAIRDQAERQRMRQMLLQSEKLASIGLLSAGVAHEINNPLAFIANNLAVLERDLGGILGIIAAYESAHEPLATAAPEALARVQALSDDLDWPYVRENLPRMLRRTREGVSRVATIVQNLRGLARTSPPKKEPALLGDLMSGALDMVQGRLKRSHIDLIFENHIGKKLPCVPSQIGQVFLNLVVNAIQALEELGRPEGNQLRITLRAAPDGQIIEVADNGPGVPEESIARLFDPFFTTKPVGEGTGLGLSISHGIITGHGGHIDVESTPGEGTVFTVFLPHAEL